MKPFVVALLLLLERGALLAAPASADCLACHGSAGVTMERGGKTVDLSVSSEAFAASVHAAVGCAGCHAGFDPAAVPHKAAITPVVCASCHKDAPAEHPFHPGNKPGLACVDCHGNHAIKSPRTAASSKCVECHSDIADKFAQSAHGLALKAGVAGAPNCATCHARPVAGGKGEAAKLARKREQEKLCLSCHLDNPAVLKRTAPRADFFAAYEKSVHGAALLGGNDAAANCVDCHGSHEMLKGADPTAKVNKSRIVETCSKCHAAVAKTFAGSVHGAALLKGNLDAPACTNCHGEHHIFKHDDPRSRVAAQNLSAQACNPCHGSIALSSKYGLNSDRFKTFSDSYHGLALKGGSVAVANCASCHGAHDIRASSDPLSRVNPANIARTCGQCHPGANERFSVGKVHASETAKAEQPILYWLASGYILLILLTIGGMFLHNLLDFLKKSKHKLGVRSGAIAREHHGHDLIVRMTLSERLQHGALALGFSALVLTGFMLRFPDAWWVRGIRWLGEGAFDARGVVHRGAAVVMVLASLYHVWYCAFTERGRELFWDLLPRWNDLTDPLAMVRYNLGLSKTKPKFGRFSYIEKSEYWALIWGTFLMTGTGLIMWFDNASIGLVTKLGYDIARTIHYYEAWLATLAILVWHFYFVIFNPEVYPLNLAFWTGVQTEHEVKEERELEYEDIQRKRAEKKASEKKPPERN